MKAVGRPALRPVAPDDDSILDTAEVPAAVVCARCGSPDCLGCLPEEENTQPSGVIAIIPWERPFGSPWSRLWTTAQASTLRAEAFFGPIANGELWPAVRFSIVCELLAVSSVAVMLIAAVGAVAPGLSLDVLRDPQLRGLLLRLVLLGVPSFAGLLVVAHLLYGWALDRGAVRAGARTHRTHWLRFGLYGTGLDLVTSPLGVVVTLFTQGLAAAAALVPAAINVPSTSARAMLRRVYHLSDAPAARARRFAGIVISLLGFAMVLGVMVFLAAALML
jgi:hypothetical protein